MTSRRDFDAPPARDAQSASDSSESAPLPTGRAISTLDGALAAALERVARVSAATLDVPATVVALLGDDRRVFTGGPDVPTWLGRDPGALLRSGLSARMMDAAGPLRIADACADNTESIARTARELGVGGFLGMYLESATSRTAALFCAMDVVPREWTPGEVSLFGEVAASALTELELQDRQGEAVRIERQLKHDALHDQLTGLPNRIFLVERLKVALERGRRRSDAFALLVIDLDNFKAVNESYGHHVGDELLAEVGRRFATCLRSADMLARLGGDEFALLLESVSEPSDAARVARRLQGALDTPVRIGDMEVFPSASIGIALPGGPDESPQRLLRSADTALYRAKEQGRARFEVFDAQMHEAAIRRLTLETDLRRALERGQLALHYQPVVVLQTGRIAAVEALLRWTHPERGAISPAEFIPVAEQSGLIVDIGAWVLDEACRQLREWRRSFAGEAPDAICVNLSVKQLLHGGLTSRVESALTATGLEPSRLKLEITESVMIDSTDMALRGIAELKTLGTRILIDDFGTGYSSLSYLARLAPDGIKVDRSFVDQMSRSEGGVALVRGIVALIRSLGLESIAEGVETAEQQRVLERMGCEYAQGFHLARPMPAQAVSELLVR
jgi:diguanylate cyclase (GGDEF)-like protein